jgi:hypothetical protein
VTSTDGSTLERTPSWRAANAAVASVDPSGALTAAAAGSTAVEATVEGVTARLTLTVTPAVVAAAPPPTRTDPTPVRPTAGRGRAGGAAGTSLPARPVLLRVQVGPTFASIYVDGTLRGEGLRLYEIELLPGEHTIRLENPRFQPHTQTVRIAAGQTPEPIRVRLTN